MKVSFSSKIDPLALVETGLCLQLLAECNTPANGHCIITQADFYIIFLQGPELQAIATNSHLLALSRRLIVPITVN